MCGWTQEKNSGEVLEDNGYTPKRSFIDCPYAGTEAAYRDVVLRMEVMKQEGDRRTAKYKCPRMVSIKHEGQCGRDLKKIFNHKGYKCPLGHQVNISIDGSTWAFMGEKAS